MQHLVESGRRRYTVILEAGAVHELATVCAGRRVLVVHPGAVTAFVTDRVLIALDGAETVATHVVPDGEAAKTLGVTESIWVMCARQRLGVGGVIVAVGGGATTDVAGFAAATWRRGIDWVAVPTTVTGMVDAALGGKTGVNTAAGKNSAGACWDPVAVISDFDALDTLPRAVAVNGIAEIVKVGLSHDPALLTTLSRWDGDTATLVDPIVRAAAVAADVASHRPGAGNVPEVLALGHEIAHAIEAVSGYTIGHGAAVASGLRYATVLAGAEARVPESTLGAVLRHVGLPTGVDELGELGAALAWDRVREALEHDTRMAGRLRFLLPTTHGTRWSDDLDEDAARRAWHQCGGT